MDPQTCIPADTARMAQAALLSAISDLLETASDTVAGRAVMDRLDDLVSLTEDAALLGKALMVISVRCER